MLTSNNTPVLTFVINYIYSMQQQATGKKLQRICLRNIACLVFFGTINFTRKVCEYMSWSAWIIDLLVRN